MFRDKITELAEKLAHSRIIAPFIIRTAPRRLQELAYELQPLTRISDNRGFEILRAPVPPLGPFPMRVFRRFDMMSAFLPREVVFRLAENRYVEKIYPDKQCFAFSQRYPTVPPDGVFIAPHKIVEQIQFTSTLWTKQLIGADVANQKGYNGNGVLVAVADTGVSRVHEQTTRAHFETTTPQHRDENGHGTWCVSCVGGSPAIDRYLSRQAGKTVNCEGVAPACGLLAIKCLGFFIGTGMTSDIIESINISIERGADVISMSLGGPSEEEFPEDDAFLPAFQEAVKQGIVPVVAAGNEGPDENTVASPGALPEVLTVGAWDPISGEMAEFSSRGPTNWGDIKPDVVAPGVSIDSGAVGLCDVAGDGVPTRFSPISGTSMATPHSAGLIALMREAHHRILGRKLTVEEIKTMMQSLGHGKSNVDGWGILSWDKYEEWMSTTYSVEI